MLLHEGRAGTVLLLGQGLILVPEQPRQKYLLEQAELLGVMVGRRRGLGVVVGVVSLIVHHLGGGRRGRHGRGRRKVRWGSGGQPGPGAAAPVCAQEGWSVTFSVFGTPPKHYWGGGGGLRGTISH